MDLNSNMGTSPMEILVGSSWGLKQKLSLQNSERPLPLWVAAHLEIQSGTVCRGGSRQSSTRSRMKECYYMLKVDRGCSQVQGGEEGKNPSARQKLEPECEQHLSKEQIGNLQNQFKYS